MKKILTICLITFSLATLPFVAKAAYRSDICKGSVCIDKEVGEFMQGIGEDCAELGNCTLEDIMLVFANIGNFILGIVAGLVLLMYIIGGFYMLTSGGAQDRVTKGKKYLQTSTIGLLIVMFAYLGVFTLQSVLRGGTTTSGIDKKGKEIEYVICDFSKKTEGELCATNSKCTKTGCTSLCESLYKGHKVCRDTDADSEFDSENCKANLCGGGPNYMCCSATADDASYEKTKSGIISAYEATTKFLKEVIK